VNVIQGRVPAEVAETVAKTHPVVAEFAQILVVHDLLGRSA
jgi:hypothetical protein